MTASNGVGGSDLAIVQRLRAATRAQHLRLELAVDLPVRLSSLREYRQFLEAFYGIYYPFETQLAAHQRLNCSDLLASRLHKHELLEQDLLALGHSPPAIAALPKCSILPDIQDVFVAAGCLYVLEGATLGGQHVRREVRKRLILPNACGCMFFDSYGPRVMEMWSAFCDWLNALAEEHSHGGDLMMKGACDTFACFEEWMR